MDADHRPFICSALDDQTDDYPLQTPAAAAAGVTPQLQLQPAELDPTDSFMVALNNMLMNDDQFMIRLEQDHPQQGGAAPDQPGGSNWYYHEQVSAGQAAQADTLINRMIGQEGSDSNEVRRQLCRPATQ